MNFQRFNQLLRMGVSPQVADAESSLFKGGAQKTETNTNQTSTPNQSEQYNNLLEGADAWAAGGGLDKNYGGQAGYDPVANLTPEQQASLAGSQGVGKSLADLYSGAGQNSLAQYLGDYNPNNTGLTGAIDAANNRSNFNFETQVNPNIRQGAQGAGQYGSSRHGIAEGLARGQLAQTQQDNASQMAYQDQQAFNQNKLGVLNNLSGITQGLNSGNGLQYDAGKIQQSQNQAEIQGELEAWAYENNVSLNDLISYKNLITGDMGGTVTGKQTQKGGEQGGNAWSTVATVGGGLIGAYFGGPMGAAAGASAGSAVSGGGGMSSTQASRY